MAARSPKGVRLRPKTADGIPENILVFDTETTTEVDPNDARVKWQTFKLACIYSYRLVKGKRTRQGWYTAHTPQEFWAVVHNHLSPQKRLWVVAHNAGFDLSIVHAWEHFSNPDWLWSIHVTEASPLILKGTFDGHPVTFLDTFNYFKCSIDSLGKSQGVPKLQIDFDNATPEQLEEYCKRDVLITANAFDSLVSYHCGHHLGSFEPTVAGLAMSAFLGSFNDHCIIAHPNRVALKLERESYYGGMVECGWLGPLPPGEYAEYDVKSMYPSVMLREYPARFKWVEDNPSLGRSRYLSREYLTIADVTLGTARHRYPVRRGSRLLFPTGEYRTTLAGPEFELAMRSNEVQRVHWIATYDGAKIFTRYVEHFYREKCLAEGKIRCPKCGQKVPERCPKCGVETEPDPVWRNIAKLYLNSLYGKFGQLSPQWQEWNAETFARMEEHYALPRGSLDRHLTNPPVVTEPSQRYLFREIGRSFDVRHVCQSVEISWQRSETYHSCPAVASYCTSYARCYLRAIIDAVGAGHHYYSDTDSILTDSIGEQRLLEGGWIDPSQLGKLELKGRYTNVVIYGPKDLVAGDSVRRKGVRAKATQVESSTFVQTQFEGLPSILRRGLDGRVAVTDTLKFLRRRPEGWRVTYGPPLFSGVWTNDPDAVRHAVRHGSPTSPLVFPEDDHYRDGGWIDEDDCEGVCTDDVADVGG